MIRANAAASAERSSPGIGGGVAPGVAFAYRYAFTLPAKAIAGVQQLGNLTVIWDDNRISIEDDTQIAFTEDVCGRYRAYGWGVIEVELAPEQAPTVADWCRVAGLLDVRTLRDLAGRPRVVAARKASPQRG